MTIDGIRLTEAQRLKLLADEEYAALQEQFYEYHCDDSRTASLVSSLLPPPQREVAQEEIAATNADPSPTYGLVRDRSQDPLLIQWLAI